MADKLYWDSQKNTFALRSESDSATSDMIVMDPDIVHVDGPISPDYVDPNRLIGLIINHNRDIRQGYIKDYPINYDETLLREAIEKYNDIVERKYRDNFKLRNK